MIDKPIIIYDYKTDVKTQYGGGKLVVYFKYPDDNDNLLKFYTNSKVLLDIISQIPKEELDSGVETTVTKFKNNRYEYYKLI